MCLHEKLLCIKRIASFHLDTHSHTSLVHLGVHKKVQGTSLGDWFFWCFSVGLSWRSIVHHCIS
jgi:hypothetical protein